MHVDIHHNLETFSWSSMYFFSTNIISAAKVECAVLKIGGNCSEKLGVSTDTQSLIVLPKLVYSVRTPSSWN